MFIDLFAPWRQNIALHCTLETREITLINKDTREKVQLDNDPAALKEGVAIKFRGTTERGIDAYVNIELIGPPDLLKLFKFHEGQHVGLVLRAID